MQLIRLKTHYKALVVIVLFSSSTIAQQEDHNSLSEDDTTNNAYIESMLSEVPPAPPAVNYNHLKNQEELVESRESAQSKLEPSLPHKESTEKLPRPAIESISKRGRKSPEELYKSLSKQTGLSMEEIEELFKGARKKNGEPKKKTVQKNSQETSDSTKTD